MLSVLRPSGRDVFDFVDLLGELVAVFAAYNWRESPDDLPDAEIVARLLALNLSREPV